MTPTTGGTPRGGGIAFNATSLSLSGTAVTGNQIIAASGQGAGIYNSKTVSITAGSTVDGNLASGRYSQGAGVYNATTGTLSVDSSSTTGNRAPAPVPRPAVSATPTSPPTP